ncbi:MAG TPA: SAM-dependent methyltransferase, partial [Verrucomicrobiales bacterium]|nr:SAM-dependent methyltransferase [Verrucomicrobiales bacterium]
MPELRNFLQQTFAQSGGVMSFEDFMAMALYHHDHGYYTAEIRDIGGRNGDFATSATLSSALGQAIARWIKKEAAVHSFRKPIDLIEIGGGNGALAEAVLQSLGWWGRRQFRFHLVEISPVLKRKQQGRLARL